jgi:hypothetical protein
MRPAPCASTTSGPGSRLPDDLTARSDPGAGPPALHAAGAARGRRQVLCFPLRRAAQLRRTRPRSGRRLDAEAGCAEAQTARDEASGESHIVRVQCDQLERLLEERTQRPDWQGLRQDSQGFLGSEVTTGARAFVRDKLIESLLDVDILPADAGEIVAIWDDVNGAVDEHGLDGLVERTRAEVERARQLADHPEGWIEPASPIVIGVAACFTLACIVAIAWLISCKFRCRPSVLLWMIGAGLRFIG